MTDSNNTEEFRKAGKSMLQRARDFCTNYSSELIGAATFIVPTVAVSALLGPWLGVPTGIASAFAGTACLANKKRTKQNLRSAAVLIGALALVGSWAGYAFHHTPRMVLDAFTEAANNICWVPNKDITIQIGGKSYTAQVTSIVQKSFVGSNESADSYYAVIPVSVDFTKPLTFGFFSSPYQYNVGTADRPGIWKTGMAREQLTQNTYIDCKPS
ncbi:MAG: hypothetical protein P4M15_04470 [Alphaproteobacteria bacterium]|nr:hypothetical protein [Alphaproteobacteria bacterium]